MKSEERLSFLCEKSKRLKGQSVIRLNIGTATLISEMVKTMLGPRGMSKMLIRGLITSVTSDTAKFLGEAPISNPVGKILVDLSKRQYEQFWDGTTSTVVLTGELLKQAKKLLDMGINPSTIASGFRIAGGKAEEVLNHLIIPVRKKDTLLKVAESSVNPRVRELSLSNLLVEAVLQVAGKDTTATVNRDMINIQPQKGGRIQETLLIKGMVMKTERIHPEIPSRIKNAKIAFLDFPIAIEKTRTLFEMRTSNETRYVRLQSEEQAIFKKTVNKIAATGANVIFCKKGINEKYWQDFANKCILITRRVTATEFELLFKATGGEAVSDPDELSRKKLGHADLVEERKIFGNRLIFVEGCENPGAVTIFVRGGNDELLENLERIIRHGIGAVTTAYTDGKVLPGGGATEVEISRALRKHALKFDSRKQLAILAFADAIEKIPEALVRNSGLKPEDLLFKIKASHEKGDCYVGFDALSNSALDVVQGGMLDAYSTKLSIFRLATETARMFLRIDDLIFAPRLSEKDTEIIV